ncbi:aminoacyltransferase [Staphylococcus caprae]|uniref:aminoacyltransferase n=1 Tax=Staphylococcus caprae TaxID=29380 RepID=UPI000CD22F26|nr:aminoacyltransferase [Staphylococcus caprae]MDI9230500.1 aminoacyltransferase [Staphylococcus caprae]POA05516.1 aminoacyltransferase [Staphylococcus caprae]SUL94610.1 FemAB family protein [Staphylococcus caprae]
MKFTTLSVDEYEKFINDNFSHYTQSSSHFNYRYKFQNDVHLLGVKDSNSEVIAACLLTEAKIFKLFKYFYTHRGPVMDFNNHELVEYFYTNLTNYLKKCNCLYVLTDPYILQSIRSSKGDIITRYNNKKLLNLMHNLGYIHQGYSIGYSQNSQIRWLSVLDLNGQSEEIILKNMDYQTRRNIKKTYEMKVKTKTLDISETKRFFKLFKMAEEKHGFKFMGIDYFEKMQNIYNKNSKVKLAYINLKELLEAQQEKLNELTHNLGEINLTLKNNPNSKKNKRKHNEIIQQLESQERKISQTQNLIKEDGEILDLAAAFFIYNKHEVYYLSSGSNPKYNAYMGAYRLQWEMIKFAINKGIPRYNFYGITGDFSEEAEDYGVQRFKEGFNAYVEEYIGDFIKPIKPGFYRLYKYLKNN